MDALLHPTTMEGLMDVAPSSGQRFEAEVAYGFPAHNDRLTVTPAVVLASPPPAGPTASSGRWPPMPIRPRGNHTAPPDHSLKLTFSTLF